MGLFDLQRIWIEEASKKTLKICFHFLLSKMKDLPFQIIQKLISKRPSMDVNTHNLILSFPSNLVFSFFSNLLYYSQHPCCERALKHIFLLLFCSKIRGQKSVRMTHINKKRDKKEDFRFDDKAFNINSLRRQIIPIKRSPNERKKNCC